jgi:hypothetical protein
MRVPHPHACPTYNAEHDTDLHQPFRARQIIRANLSALPRRCGGLAYSPARPHLARAVTPSCTAAVLFTARGAARALEHLHTVTDPIDVLLPRLIEEGLLLAYHALPGVHFQDSAWGSNAGRASNNNCKFQVSGGCLAKIQNVMRELLDAARLNQDGLGLICWWLFELGAQQRGMLY